MTEPLPAGLGAAAELAESGMAGTCAMRGGSDELAEPGGVPGPASGADDDLPGGSDEPVGHGDPPAAASNVSLRPSDAPTGLSLGDETDDGTVDNLPTGWRSTTLGEVAVVVRDRIDPSESGPLAYLGLEHLVSGRRSVHAWGSTEGVKSTVTPFWAGDTLFGRLRPYLRKGCAAPFGGACTTEILVLRALESVDARFLSLLVLNDRVFNECMHMSTGTRMPRVSAKNLMGITVLVPPLEEQRRIVEVVEELLSRLDAAEGRVADARAKLDQLERSILHDALTPPRAISENPPTHPDQLADTGDLPAPARVVSDEALGDPQSPALGSLVDEDSTGQAGGWRSTTLGKVAVVVRDRIDPSESGPQAYLGLEHLASGSRSVHVWGSTEGVKSTVTPFWAGDTLFGRLRPYLRKGCAASFDGVCTTEILVLRALESVDARFLSLLVLNDRVFNECMHMSTGTRMPRVSAKNLLGITVLVPTVEEQRRIVEMVEERLGCLEPLKQAVDSASEQAVSLRRSILTAALSGRLTSQERAA